MTGTSGWGGTAPEAQPWVRGPWSAVRQGDELADVAFHGRTVLRSIRAVVRDRDWRTVPPAVEGVTEEGGVLRIALRFTGLGADLVGDLVVTASDHELRTELALTSRTDFDRNRIGLVVLHAAALAGAPLEVGHPDGSRTVTRFPDRIAPHQPALDVRTLTWTARGLACRLALTGDVFEMEDQRNWTDASFKTYSTPLVEPFPVRVRAGEAIRQAAALVCAVQHADDDAPDSPAIDLVRRDGRLPEYLLCATTEQGALLRADAPDLLVELAPDAPGWVEALARAAAEADGGALDVRIVTDRPEAVRAVVAELRTLAVRVARIGVFSPVDHGTCPAAWAALRDAVVAGGLAAELVGGTRAHFTELNRQHAALPADLPSLTFSSTPQMHATEDRQVVESIDAQRLTAEDAVRIAAGRPVHIGPVTLRPRFNAVATAGLPPLAGTAAGLAPLDADATDPRQSAPALAAWLVASAAALSRPGVRSVAWFEASGPRGLRSLDGDAFPVRRAFLQVLELAGAEAYEAVGAPRSVHVLAATSGGRTVALVANLRDSPVDVVLRLGSEGCTATIPPQEHRRLVLES